jgi:nucleotide-binding universal stress UspA family protein
MALRFPTRRWMIYYERAYPVVTCYEPLGLQIDPSLLEPEKLRAEEIQKEAVVMLRAAGLKASGKALLADAGNALIEEAETWKADCVFVGARGLNAFERLLLGSVSSKVADHASCSVEVVRFPE